MDLELRGEGPAVINLGVVTVLMVFKKGVVCQITQEVMHGELEGLRGILVLCCQAGPPLAPGVTLPRASWIPVVSSVGCRSLWLVPIRAEPGPGSLAQPGMEGGWRETTPLVFFGPPYTFSAS